MFYKWLNSSSSSAKEIEETEEETGKFVENNTYDEMNEQQFKTFLETMKDVWKAPPGTSTGSTSANVPYPKPLDVDTGDVGENFKLFRDNWKTYCVATGMDKWNQDQEVQKVSILLAMIGDAAKKKYSGFNLTADEKKDTESVLKALEEKIVSKRNLLYDRYVFQSCNQMPDEEFDAYVIRLRKAVDLCKYDANITADIMMRDRIAFGVNDINLRRSFLQADPDKLTLAKIMEECKTHELTKQRFDELSGAGAIDMSVKKVVNLKERTAGEKNWKMCRFCGSKHKFLKELCPAYGANCGQCGKKNHFAKMCINQTTKEKKRKKSRRVKKLNQNDSDTSESSSDSEENVRVISEIVDDSKNGGSVKVSLKLRCNGGWKNELCEIDTGSAVCVIGYENLCRLLEAKCPKLDRSTVKLKAFGGTDIKTLGQKAIRCNRKGEKFDIIFQVVDKNHGPLLSANVSRLLGLVKFCKEVKSDEMTSNQEKLKCNEAEELINKYSKLFEGYGSVDNEINLEIDPNVPPSIQPPRRVAMSLREDLKKELDQMTKDEIIRKEEESTPWVSNILLVKQKGKVRICLDPIPLNRALKRPHFQSATLDEILPELDGAKVFTTVDLKKGFWHFKLNEESSKLTTFWTPFGRYRWLRLPFGLNSSPEIFAMRMRQIVQGLKGVEILADDILVFGRGNTMEEAMKDHNKNLENLFKKLLQYGCRLNKDKLKLCQSSVLFYGHILTNEGIKPDPLKVIAIRDMPRPENKKDLGRVIGMVTYLSRYIPNLSDRLTALRRLYNQKTDWSWTDAEEVEFAEVKRAICSVNGLKYMSKNSPIVMETDASNLGLGVAVFQGDKAVGFASRTLKNAEKNYAPIEKEMLAIVFACKRFDQFILGNQVTIKTDHHPLISIFKKPLLNVPRRLQQMRLTLQRYDLNVEYVKGKNNVVADGLSRAPVDINAKLDNNEIIDRNVLKIMKSEERISKIIGEVNQITNVELSEDLLHLIRKESSIDSEFKTISNYVMQGWPANIKDVTDEVRIYFKFKDEFSLQQGLLIRNDRIVIPRALRSLLIRKLHAAHSGMNFTLNLARDNVFWPGMSDQIKDTISKCEKCGKYAASQQKPPMKSSKIPEYPFQFVSLDVFFWEDKKGKQRKFLVTVDHYSDFFEIDELKDMTAETMTKICEKNFSRHGSPEEIITDNGTNLVNKEMKKLARKWNFKIATSSPHHQQANGKAEATVKIAKNLLKKSDSEADFWLNLLIHRNTPNDKGTSPSQRMFARRTKSSIPTLKKRLLPTVIQNVPEKIRERKEKAKFYYDRSTRRHKELEEGQPVYVQLNPSVSHEWSSGIIQEKLSDRSYKVNTNGTTIRRDALNVRERRLSTQREEEAGTPAETTNNQANSHQQNELVQPQDDTRSTEVVQEEQTRQPRHERPRRERRIPEKLKDYHLNY